MKYAKVSEDDMLVIAELEKAIQIYEDLRYLEGLPQFNNLIKHFTEDRALNLTYSLATLDNVASNTDNVTRQLTSIAFFKDYLGDVTSEGERAIAEKQSILDGEQP